MPIKLSKKIYSVDLIKTFLRFFLRAQPWIRVLVKKLDPHPSENDVKLIETLKKIIHKGMYL